MTVLTPISQDDLKPIPQDDLESIKSTLDVVPKNSTAQILLNDCLDNRADCDCIFDGVRINLRFHHHKISFMERFAEIQEQCIQNVLTAYPYGILAHLIHERTPLPWLIPHTKQSFLLTLKQKSCKTYRAVKSAAFQRIKKVTQRFIHFPVTLWKSVKKLFKRL